jgi:soluble lytic murein transglycosylase-like protein
MQQLRPFSQIGLKEEVHDSSAETTLAAAQEQEAVSPERSSVAQVQQSVPPSSPSSPVRTPVWIRAETKRKKAAPDQPQLHLRPRARHMILLLAVVVCFALTLTTLVPLATGQANFPFSQGFSSLLHSAQQELQSLVQQNNPVPTTSTGTLPSLTIPHSQLVALAEADATAAGISPIYFVRQITLESGFNPNAISPGGAEGIAQFEPSTAAGLGIDPFNPTEALQAAAQMMARYYHQYGDYAKALAAYNAGSGSLQSAVNSCGSSWLSCMPAQTQHYVAVIMGT